MNCKYNRKSLIMPIILILLFISFFIYEVHAIIGQSAIITLVFPYGTRQDGMGEVGVALGDDNSTCFYNPAGLGIRAKQSKMEADSV